MSEVLIAFIAGMFVATTICCSLLPLEPMYPSSMQYSLGFENGYRKAMEDYKPREAEGSKE